MLSVILPLLQCGLCFSSLARHRQPVNRSLCSEDRMNKHHHLSLRRKSNLGATVNRSSSKCARKKTTERRSRSPNPTIYQKKEKEGRPFTHLPFRIFTSSSSSKTVCFSSSCTHQGDSPSAGLQLYRRSPTGVGGRAQIEHPPFFPSFHPSLFSSLPPPPPSSSCPQRE